jgi:hypothetical protein
MKFPARREVDFAVEFPLATSSSLWAILYGTLSLVGRPASKVMASLPYGVQAGWAILVMTAAVVTMSGLYRGSLLLVARGMALMAAGVLAYGVAVAGNAGWWQGGMAAGLATAMALGLVARAYRIRLILQGIRYTKGG